MRRRVSITLPWAAGLAILASAIPAAAQEPPPLTLEEVLASVESDYPPLLAARIERDVAKGRMRSARGIFDTELFGKVGGTLDGYYEYTAVEAGVERFLGLWGTTVYGGYRLTRGEELPAYYRNRTQESGELSFGLRIPFLRGGPLDGERASLEKSAVGLRAVEPLVARQRLDFVRAATVAYFRWVAAGRERALAAELLALAQARTGALERQVADGLRAEIDQVDNARLVVAREIAFLEADRDFRAAGVTLSLFLRSEDGAPQVPDEGRLPAALPEATSAVVNVESDLERALRVRPELAIRALEVARIEIELRLAENRLLPTLDADVGVARSLGEARYGDIARSELRAAVELKLPVRRREASGRAQVVRAELEQARQELRFAADEVAAEIRVLATELEATGQLVRRAEINRALAEELREAEAARFRAGSSDLLALQIREQAAFEAERTLLRSRLALQEAWADYRAAAAHGVEGSAEP